MAGTCECDGQRRLPRYVVVAFLFRWSRSQQRMSANPPLAASLDRDLPGAGIGCCAALLRALGTDLGCDDLGRPNLAQQSAAHQRARVAELCHLPPACAQPVDRVARCRQRRLRCHHVCVEDRDRYRVVIGRVRCSLRQCAVVDLCAAVAAACALAMDAVGAWPLHSVVDLEKRHGDGSPTRRWAPSAATNRC
jgi:hypothetical protein